MSLVDLPVELLDVIFEPLTSTTLAALARTNEHLNPSASRLLYRHLALSSHDCNLAAVSTLASRPHLASLVRTFAITVGEGAEGVEAEYYVQLSQAVRGMKDLTSLEVHIDASLSWVLLKGSPANELSPYPRLEHFACSFGLDANISLFLVNAPSLLSLQLAPSADYVELPSTVIPRLTTYTGPPTILPHLLSTRPVTSLHLQGDLSLDDISHLAKTVSAPGSAAAHECTAYSRAADGDIPSNATVETLSTITSAQPVAVIEALAQACPYLVSLQVITTCPLWQAPDIVSPGSTFSVDEPS